MAGARKKVQGHEKTGGVVVVVVVVVVIVSEHDSSTILSGFRSRSFIS